MVGYSRRNPYTGKITPSILDPNAFDALIRDYGCKARHQSASICPCYYGRIESGQQKLKCTRCENGYLTYDSTEIFVYLENTDLEKQFMQFGVWDVGTAHMFTPAKREDGTEFYLGYFDKITILDFSETYSEVIQKGKGDVDILKYKALEIVYLGSDRKTFSLGSDFQLNDDGNIRWVGTNQPSYDLEREVGEVYTVRYLRNPVYRVMEIFHENRVVLTGVGTGVQKLPKRMVQECLIRKDFLINKTNGSSNVGQGQG